MAGITDVLPEPLRSQVLARQAAQYPRYYLPTQGTPPQTQEVQSASFGSLSPQGGSQDGQPTIADLFAPNPDWAPGAQDQIAQDWANTPASQASQQDMLTKGYRYRTPAQGSPLLSSGPQGGWFSGEGLGTTPAASGPGAAYYQGYGGYDNPAAGPPAGMVGPSTFNYRLLPPGYNTPQYYMQMGHIIDRNFSNPARYAFHGGEGSSNYLGGPGEGYPASAGTGPTRGYFFPGQIEPWMIQGGGNYS